ncbi:UNVERIFIED_CONTAM: hypothetical protein FKN15_062810 [Acipenser sinensis]
MRPPKRATAKPSFFALRIHIDATRPIVPEDNTDLAAPLQNHRHPIGHRGVADACNYPHDSGDPKVQVATSDPMTKPASFFTQGLDSGCQ